MTAMTSRGPWRWPVPPLYLPSHAGPDNVTLRPCGCRIDPTVFGHYECQRQKEVRAAWAALPPPPTPS